MRRGRETIFWLLLFCGGGGEEIRILVAIKKCVDEHNRQRFIFKKKERKKERKKKLKIKYGRRSIRRARVENTREKRTREKKAREKSGFAVDEFSVGPGGSEWYVLARSFSYHFFFVFLGISQSGTHQRTKISLFLFLTSCLTEDNEHDAEVNATHAENARFENLETIIERARRKMETVLEKSIEKEKREEEEKQNVLTERTKNEAQRAETHAKLRHEVRTDIAEDAKMSWYFEMLDDVGKQMGIVSDDSVTNSNSTTNERNTTTTSEEEDDESESENESESESEQALVKTNGNRIDNVHIAQNNEIETRSEEWISSSAKKNREKKEEKKSARAMKKVQMKESIANKREINERLLHILRLADADYDEVVTQHKSVMEEIRRKTEQQVHEFEKEAIETKQAFEQFLRDDCLNKLFRQNAAALGKLYEEIAQTEVAEIEKASALLATRDKEIDDVRERERISVENEREILENDLEENETILRRLHIENLIHEDRLQRVAKEFSTREKARRNRASILDRKTKDEYRALSEAKRLYEEKLVECEYAARKLAWRSKDAAAKLLRQHEYERKVCAW